MLSFSVVIPAYKSSKYIPRLVESIIKSSQKTFFDVIFVDSGGHEEIYWQKNIYKLSQCPQICKILLIKNKKNRGVTFSRNRGYLLSKSDYVIFMDSDDLFTPNAIDIIASDLDRSSIVDVALFSTQYSSNIKCESKNAYCLIKDYGQGERLLVVRKISKGVPFCGALKGHEFYGLLKFLYKYGGAVKTFSSIVRVYTQDNENSLTIENKNIPMRIKLMAIHHIKSSYLLLIQGFLFTGIIFLLKGIYRFLQFYLKY